MQARMRRQRRLPGSISSRGRIGDDDTLQRSPGKQEILPCLCLVRQVAQQIRRVVGHDERNAAVPVNAPAQARDRRVGFEQRRCRALAQRDDQLRPDQRGLAVEIGTARLDLARLGRAIVRRPALEDVGDVDVLTALHSEGRQHVVEEPARLPDEGLAPGVLFAPRRLADEQPVGVDVAHSGDGSVPGAREPACGARVDVRREIAPLERSRFAPRERPAPRPPRPRAHRRRPARRTSFAPPIATGAPAPEVARRRHVGVRPSSVRISLRSAMAGGVDRSVHDGDGAVAASARRITSASSRGASAVAAG